MSKVVTANDLATGRVLFMGSGGWVRDFDQATVFENENEVEAALDQANQDAARCLIVDPFAAAIGASAADGPPKMTLRDTIRAFGPTIRFR